MEEEYSHFIYLFFTKLNNNTNNNTVTLKLYNMKKIFWIDGGAGRVIAAIPAFILYV